MANKILVYIDQFKGQPLPASWEALGAGLQLAEKLGGGVTALIAGPQSKAIAAQAFQYGASEVLVSEDPAFQDYLPDPFATLISKTAQDQGAEALLFPTTTRGRELAALCAIDLGTGVMPDATGLDVQDGQVVATRPVYAGKLISRVRTGAKPQIITTRTRAFEKPALDASRTGTPTEIQSPVGAGDLPVKVIDYAPAEGGVSLTEASVIVSGGRGVANNPTLTPPAGMDEKEAEIWRAQQGFKLVSDLAEALGAAVGASRAAVDAGYIPYAHQVGQTGKVVTPDLYIACGISGAIQHLAGMRNSKMIVAINKDPEAPIFKLARFGVVGDLHAILPALTEAFRQRLGK